MWPPSSAVKPPSAAVQNPSGWRFAWEAQSHTPTLRLLLFNPLAQCRDLKLKLIPEHSLLTVSFLGDEDVEVSVRVPVPRVLVDPESQIHFRAFYDHIEVKLVLLLPVDHPLVSNFDTIVEELTENVNELQLSMESDLKKLSCMEEVYFYCRNCSTKLTKGLRCFEEMPSVNWREAADNWFGNCCCSFGGESEKLVAEFVKSYMCAPGICLLSTSSMLICKDDLLGSEFPDAKASKKIDTDLNSHTGSCSSSDCSRNHDDETPCIVISSSTEHNTAANPDFTTLKESIDDHSLSCTFPTLRIEENQVLMNDSCQIGNCDSGCCTHNVLETSSAVQVNGANELLENHKVFLNGFLGDGFMVRSSGLSKDIRWTEYMCPKCSCIVGAYPCFEDNVPLDDGVRLFKCYVSTCLPLSGLDDAFRNYTLERMFTNQLLESAEDELSFRSIVRDMKTKSPALQIVLLNPNSWCCTGCLQSMEPAAKLVMNPTVKVLFSSLTHEKEFELKTVEDWVRNNQAGEIFMFSSQITELIQALELANSLSPPSYTSVSFASGFSGVQYICYRFYACFCKRSNAAFMRGQIPEEVWEYMRTLYTSGVAL